jgi:hypothetical protein
LGAGEVSILDQRERLAMAVYTCSEPLYGLHSLCVPVCHGHRISVCQIARSEHAELSPRRARRDPGALQKAVEQCAVERRAAVEEGGACPSWSRGAKRPGRITVQKSGAVEMRGAVEERVRAGPAARRDPGITVQKSGAVEMRGAVRHRAGGEEVQGRRRWLLRGLPVSGLSVCLHTISSPRQWVVCLSPYRIIASCAAAPSSRTKSSDDCGWSAGARGGRRGGGGGESGGRRSGGGLRDRMCVGEGAVRLSVSSWLRHHSSVTISSPREGGSAEQQDG